MVSGMADSLTLRRPVKREWVHRTTNGKGVLDIRVDGAASVPTSTASLRETQMASKPGGGGLPPDPLLGQIEHAPGRGFVHT